MQLYKRLSHCSEVKGHQVQTHSTLPYEPEGLFWKTLQLWNSIWTNCAVLMISSITASLDQLLFLWRCEAECGEPETGPGSLLMKQRGTMYTKNLSLFTFLDQEETDRCNSQPADSSHTEQTDEYSLVPKWETQLLKTKDHTQGSWAFWHA